MEQLRAEISEASKELDRYQLDLGGILVRYYGAVEMAAGVMAAGPESTAETRRKVGRELDSLLHETAVIVGRARDQRILLDRKQELLRRYRLDRLAGES